MSKKLLALNVLLAGLAVFFAAWLIRDLAASRPLPPQPAPRKVAAAGPEEAPQEKAAEDTLTGYNVIVAKYLFNPSRSEGAAEVVRPAVPLPPRPILLGVVVDGRGSRAYLEDPSTKRVFGYQMGDSVAGGKLEKITDDRIQISRSDGLMEVMLRDPSKPRPAPPAPPAAATPPGGPKASPQAPGVAGPQVESPAPVARPFVPPRSLRRLPLQPTDQ